MLLARHGQRADGDDQLIGERIQLARNACGMSRPQLGAILNLSKGQIANYEKGADRVPAKRLWEIARATGRPIDFFFETLAAACEPAAETDADRAGVSSSGPSDPALSASP